MLRRIPFWDYFVWLWILSKWQNIGYCLLVSLYISYFGPILTCITGDEGIELSNTLILPSSKVVNMASNRGDLLEVSKQSLLRLLYMNILLLVSLFVLNFLLLVVEWRFNIVTHTKDAVKLAVVAVTLVESVCFLFCGSFTTSTNTYSTVSFFSLLNVIHFAIFFSIVKYSDVIMTKLFWCSISVQYLVIWALLFCFSCLVHTSFARNNFVWLCVNIHEDEIWKCLRLDRTF